MAAPSDVTVKLDLYGSWASLGVDSNRRDRALRRCLIGNLIASVGDGSPGGDPHRILQTAQEFTFDAVGLFHHTILDLRLQDIRARQWGKSKVWIDLIYFRGFENTGFLDGPNGGTFEYTSSISSAMPVYRHTTDTVRGEPSFGPHGLPAGPLLGNAPDRLTDQTRFPTFKMWEREATSINIPTVLLSHPYSFPGPPAVADLIGKVNSDKVSIGSISFAPFTLKFETANVTIRFTGHGVGPAVYYDTMYEFVAMNSGHYHQEPIWDANVTPQRWDTQESVQFPDANFVGAFPLGI